MRETRREMCTMEYISRVRKNGFKFGYIMYTLRDYIEMLSKKLPDRFRWCFQVGIGLEDLENLISALKSLVPCIATFKKLVFYYKKSNKSLTHYI